MTSFTWIESARLRRLAVAVVAATIIAVGLSVSAAGPWPPLRQGMWEISRVMQAPGGGPPKTVSTKRCMNPADEWDRQHASLTKGGCRISPVTKTGNTYTFTASCNVMGTSSNTTSTIVAEGDSAYTLTVDGQTDGSPTKEKATGTRIGDCGR